MTAKMRTLTSEEKAILERGEILVFAFVNYPLRQLDLDWAEIEELLQIDFEGLHLFVSDWNRRYIHISQIRSD